MSSLGEKDTIVRYPGLIEALVAEGRDPLASAVNLAEFRAAISPLGFPAIGAGPAEWVAATVPVPTLLIWGDHDPVGAADSAQTTAMLIPEGSARLLPGGHVPYLGRPGASSRTRPEFVR